MLRMSLVFAVTLLMGACSLLPSSNDGKRLRLHGCLGESCLIEVGGTVPFRRAGIRMYGTNGGPLKARVLQSGEIEFFASYAYAGEKVTDFAALHRFIRNEVLEPYPGSYLIPQGKADRSVMEAFEEKYLQSAFEGATIPFRYNDVEGDDRTNSRTLYFNIMLKKS